MSKERSGWLPILLASILWGCSEVVYPTASIRVPGTTFVDPRCCPLNAPSGCGCPLTLAGSSLGTGDTAGVAIYIEQSIISPDSVSLKTSGGAPTVNGAMMADSVVVYIAVDSGGAGNHLPNRSVSLIIKAVDSLATGSDAPYAHYHKGQSGTIKPKGQLTATSVNTGPQGLVTVTYHSGQVSGPITLGAQSSGALPNRVSLAVAIPGLVALVERPSDSLVGYTWAHPISHFGLPIMVAKLDTLADEYFSQFGDKIQLNDMALPLGGKFDLDSMWDQVAGRHFEHRVGRDIDVRSKIMSVAESNFVKVRWVQLGGETVFREATPPHFHLRYRGTQ